MSSPFRWLWNTPQNKTNKSCWRCQYFGTLVHCWWESWLYSLADQGQTWLGRAELSCNYQVGQLGVGFSRMALAAMTYISSTGPLILEKISPELFSKHCTGLSYKRASGNAQKLFKSLTISPLLLPHWTKWVTWLSSDSEWEGSTQLEGKGQGYRQAINWEH